MIEAARFSGDVERAANLRKCLDRSFAAWSAALQPGRRKPQVLIAAFDSGAVGEAEAKDLFVTLRIDAKDPMGLPVGADHQRPSLNGSHRNVAGRRQDRGVQRLGFPHAGPRREDHEVAGLEAAGEPIEVGEARGDAGDLFLPLVERLDVLEGGGDDGLHVHEAHRVALLGDGEDATLAFVGELADVSVLLVSELGDGAGRLDQAARQRLLVDDLRVVGEVRRGGDDLVQQVDELVAANGLERAHGRQLVLDGDAVDGLALAEQRAHRLEDLAVSVAVELLRADDLDHLGERLGVEQDAAEEALLRVQIVRRHAAVGQGDDVGGNAHRSILRMRV